MDVLQPLFDPDNRRRSFPGLSLRRLRQALGEQPRVVYRGRHDTPYTAGCFFRRNDRRLLAATAAGRIDIIYCGSKKDDVSVTTRHVPPNAWQPLAMHTTNNDAYLVTTKSFQSFYAPAPDAPLKALPKPPQRKYVLPRGTTLQHTRNWRLEQWSALPRYHGAVHQTPRVSYYSQPNGIVSILGVGDFRDSFLVQRYDPRQSASETLVFYDTQHRNPIVGQCFLNENYVATMSHGYDRGLFLDVMLWDVRMGGNLEIKHHGLFPNHNVFGIRPIHRHSRVVHFSRNASQIAVHGTHALPQELDVPGLEPLTVSNDGHLVMTTFHDRCKRDSDGKKQRACRQHVIHALTGMILHESTQTIRSYSEDVVCRGGDVIAFCRGFDCATEGISLLEGATSLHGRSSSHQFAGRKRSRDSDSSDLTAHLNETEITLWDEYGCRAELSAIAVNRDGTRLVGMSNDGDIYSWGL